MFKFFAPETHVGSHELIQAMHANKTDRAGVKVRGGSESIQFSFGMVPRTCPRCNTDVDFRFRGVYWDREASKAIAAWECQSGGCGAPHATVMTERHDRAYTVLEIEPPYVTNTKFSERISEVSPVFVECFHQAEEALGMNLDHIAGIGFRKAYEFLLKDFACYISSDDTEKKRIAGLNLKDVTLLLENSEVLKGKVIPPKSKTTYSVYMLLCDTAHYVRKYDRHDLDSMVKFMMFIVATIQAYLDMEDLEKEASTIDRDGYADSNV